MIGMPMSGVSHIYINNMSIIHDNSKPVSALKKRCNIIAYHAINESVAMGETLTGHIRSENNPVELLTNVVIGQKRKHHESLVLSRMCDRNTKQ